MDYKQLSKKVAYALRHAPEQYGLTLDNEGWTPVADLLAALRKRRREWQGLTEADLIAMMERSEKQRYEMCDGRIRAYYGHSMAVKIQKTPAEPPDILYHGTALETARLICEEGLKAMRRQYVHLSTERETAWQVGWRHCDSPVILEIESGKAHQAGVRFYLGNNDVWLADAIPPEFIKAPVV